MIEKKSRFEGNVLKYLRNIVGVTSIVRGRKQVVNVKARLEKELASRVDLKVLG